MLSCLNSKVICVEYKRTDKYISGFLLLQFLFLSDAVLTEGLVYYIIIDFVAYFFLKKEILGGNFICNINFLFLDLFWVIYYQT